MSDLYLIVGLGNPGKKYAHTRHNVGFRTVDELARRHGLAFGKKERRAEVASGVILGKKVLLAKPQTYMNLSGESVRGLVDFYKIDLERIIVVFDDLDIPLGTLRLRKSGGSSGHGGMNSIIQHLGTESFNRVRIGVGRPPGRMDAVDYVLGEFKGDDAITMQIVIERAASSIETWLTDGIELAMSRHNGDIDEPKRQRSPSIKQENQQEP